MSDVNDSQTSLTLLHRLSVTPADQSAWNAFVQLYGDRIRRWCQAWGMSSTDADDVSQNVLMNLTRQMQRFAYKPTGRFRSWLKTVAHNAWYDYQHKRKKLDQASGNSDVLNILNSVEAHDDFLRALDQECEREQYEQAKAAVQQRVQPQTWQAFELLTLENLSGEEVASRLGITVGAAHVAKSRVRGMLAKEIERIDQPDE